MGATTTTTTAPKLKGKLTPRKEIPRDLLVSKRTKKSLVRNNRALKRKLSKDEWRRQFAKNPRLKAKIVEDRKRSRASKKAWETRTRLGSDVNRARVLAANAKAHDCSVGTMKPAKVRLDGVIWDVPKPGAVAWNLKKKYQSKLAGDDKALDDETMKILETDAKWVEYLGVKRETSPLSKMSTAEQAETIAKLAKENNCAIGTDKKLAFKGGMCRIDGVAGTLKGKYQSKLAGDDGALDDETMQILKTDAKWVEFLDIPKRETSPLSKMSTADQARTIAKLAKENNCAIGTNKKLAFKGGMCRIERVAGTLKGKYQSKLAGDDKALDDETMKILKTDAKWVAFLDIPKRETSPWSNMSTADQARTISKLAKENNRTIGTSKKLAFKGGMYRINNVAGTLKRKYQSKLAGDDGALDDETMQILKTDAKWAAYL